MQESFHALRYAEQNTHSTDKDEQSRPFKSLVRLLRHDVVLTTY